MKKILNISVIAALAALPTFAFADPAYQGGSAQVLTGDAAVTPFALSADAANDGTNVVTASYVKGAYNDAIRKINTVAANATSGATTQITNAAGDGLTGSNGVLSVNVTSAGGLAITNDALNVVTDGATITKDGTTGALQVGAITESQVTNLTTDLDNKQGKFTNGAAEGDTTISTTVKTAVATTGASDNSLVTEKAVRDAITAATNTAGMVTTDGAQTLTNKTIDFDNNTISNIEVDNFKNTALATSVSAPTNAVDTKLATEKAVADALSTGTFTLTNKTFDANGTGNSISNLETGDFASGVIVDETTGIAATGASDTKLPTEAAVRSAITTATNGMVTTTSLNNNSLAVNASALKVGGKDAATQTAVVNTINNSKVTIPVLATWGGTTTTAGSTLTVVSGTYAEPTSSAEPNS